MNLEAERKNDTVLRAYQRRWANDPSRFAFAVKGAQIGYSTGTASWAVDRCLTIPNRTIIFLSKSKPQARELTDKAKTWIDGYRGVAAQYFQNESVMLGETEESQHRIQFPIGSRIIALAANPDTARGYTGDVVLDEFAFHKDADAIFRATYRQTTLGFSMRVLSTPNGQQGRFYKMAHSLGLDTGTRPPRQPVKSESGIWSGHWCDIYLAVEEGFPVDAREVHAGSYEAGGDEETWLQEFCCQFISTAENFFPPELIAACLSSQATMDGDLLDVPPDAELFLGIDIGRKKDRSVFWVDQISQLPAAPPEAVAQVFASNHPFDEGMKRGKRRVAIAKLVKILDRIPFREQLGMARELMSLKRGEAPLIRRACIDATGIGAMLAEELEREFGHRVEPVVFTMQAKEDMAYRVKRRMEDRLDLLPDVREVVRAFSAVKRYVTQAGNVRFDAERTDAGHADEFWAKALADLAADSGPQVSTEHRVGVRCASEELAAYC